MAGRRKRKGSSKRRGSRSCTVIVKVVGGGSGRSYGKKSRRGKGKRKGSRRWVTSKSGRKYARTKSGRFKHVASAIGGRAHRKWKRRRK